MKGTSESAVIGTSIPVSKIHYDNWEFQLRLELPLDFPEKTEDVNWPQAFKDRLTELGARQAVVSIRCRTLGFYLHNEADIKPMLEVVANCLRGCHDFDDGVEFIVSCTSCRKTDAYVL